MKTIFRVLLFALLLFNSTISLADELIDGIYIGWKKISDISPNDKSEVWYHEHKLIIKGNAIRIEAAPRSIKNGKLMYSASDGGFPTYEGKIFYKNGGKFIKLRVIKCDYCGRPVSGKWPEREFPIDLENEVTIVFDSVRYVLQEAE